MSDLMTYFVWNLVQCLFRGDLLQGRPSTNQFHEKLPWFLKATPTADCTKGGYGAYLNSLDLNGASFSPPKLDMRTCQTFVCFFIVTMKVYLKCEVAVALQFLPGRKINISESYNSLE